MAALVERAFRYRGDVTVLTVDGGSVTGYLFNRSLGRDAGDGEAYVQLFETGSGREVTLAYAAITGLEFTGADAADVSARRWESFRERRADSDMDWQDGQDGCP